MNDLLKQKLRSIGASETDVERLTRVNEDAPKLISMKMLEKISDFVPFFYYLFKTTRDNPFYISDNPVTLQNKEDFGVYGNLGLDVKGIEIYMPLSKQLSLGIFCPSHEEELHRLHQQLTTMHQNQPETIARLGRHVTWLNDFKQGMTSGAAVNLHPDVVLNLNSLQVCFSSRFIFCSRVNQPYRRQN